jgi:hypothetical protein
MRTISLTALLLIGLAACSGDAKSLTEDGNAALGSGDNKAALADFEKALDKIGTDTKSSQYLQASLGRCKALAHVDPNKAATEFIALAKAEKGRILEGDVSLIAYELLRAGTNDSRMRAIDVMVAGNELFPESTKLKGIGNEVMAAAERAKDPESIKRLNGLGYGGSGK